MKRFSGLVSLLFLCGCAPLLAQPANVVAKTVRTTDTGPTSICAGGGPACAASTGGVRAGSLTSASTLTLSTTDASSIIFRTGLYSANVGGSFDGTGLFTANVGIKSLSTITAGGLVPSGVLGTPVVVATGRVIAVSTQSILISTFSVGAADASFEVSANMNVTASTTLATTLTCSYTDESNAARVMVFPVASLSGSFVAAGAITGAGATVWETPVMHIRAKAGSTILIQNTAGTFSGVTYTAEGIIKQTK